MRGFLVHPFFSPPQDFKMRAGSRPQRAATLEDAGEVVSIDEDAGRICLKIGIKAAPYEAVFSLIPEGPRDAAVLRDAVYRYADTVIAGGADYSAIASILKRERPRVRGLQGGADIITSGVDIVGVTVSTILRLDLSHQLIQRAPGAGKIFPAGSAVAGVLSKGRRDGAAA